MLMLIHATGGCATTLSESALKIHSGRTILCRTGELNPNQYCAGRFGRSLNPLSYLIPIVSIILDSTSSDYYT